MEKWYLLLNLIFAAWVLADGFKRKANAAAWAIGTLLFGSYIFPVYLMVRQPLKAEESKKDRAAWRFLKNFAFFWAIILWTILLIVAGIWKDRSTVKAVEGENSEYKLAVLNAKCRVSRENDAVVRFGSLLDQLSANYVEDRQQIASISLIAQKKMKSYGIKDKSKNGAMLDMMEGLNAIFRYRELKNQKYAEYASAYVNLRQAGQSHKQAVEALQAMVRGY